MCGKRLNDWNTIPIPRRTTLTSTPRPVTSSPRTRIRPESIGSSRLMQRSSVDFPEPDAPMRQTTSCSASARSIPRSTSVLPNDFRRPSICERAHASLPACCRRLSRATSQSVNRAIGIVSAMKMIAVAMYGRVIERCRDLDLGLPERLDHAEQSDERRVLLEPDEVVEERRDHAAHRLRDHDVAQRLAVRQPERARGGGLARVHRLDAGAVHLRDVGRVHEDERDDTPEQRVDRDARERERRDPEAEDVDDEDGRHSAEEIDVDHGKCPHREEHWPGKPPQHRDRRARRRG